jgi:hypothetical protein
MYPFSLSNVESDGLLSLIYSALNLRSHMIPSDSSYFHLAVGYFNIILPTLIPSSLTPSELFWHRARSTKSQTQKAVRSPFALSRFRNTSRVRAERSIKWAKIDDEEASSGIGMCLEKDKQTIVAAPSPPGPKMAPIRAVFATPGLTSKMENNMFDLEMNNKEEVLPPASQKAVLGVSMLGNLDGIYKHGEYPEIRLESLMTGSRQRPYGLLLFAYTFT